jgi:hypothetical protein
MTTSAASELGGMLVWSEIVLLGAYSVMKQMDRYEEWKRTRRRLSASDEPPNARSTPRSRFNLISKESNADFSPRC